MSISKYEAAAFYDYSISALKNDALYITIDLDDCSVGVCKCDPKQKVRLTKIIKLNQENIFDVCIDSIYSKLNLDDNYDLQTEFESQLDNANDIMKRYIISDKLMDNKMMAFLNYTILCSEFEEMIKPAKEMMQELFDDISEVVGDEMLAEARFIILGKAQELYLINYYIREYFSASPLLADDRFRNESFNDSFGNIVSMGMELYDKSLKIDHDIWLMLFDSESNSEKSICMVKKGDSEDSLKDLEYFGPIMILKNDALSIKIDNEIKKVNLPYSDKLNEGDVIDLLVKMNDSIFVLLIRRVLFPNEIYSVKLCED